jgi:hypothetical protein
VHLHEAQAAFRSNPAQTTCSCSRILQEAGKANKTVYAFFLDVRKAIRSGGMGYPQLLEKVWMESYGGSCET